jgi:hypothetical protein
MKLSRAKLTRPAPIAKRGGQDARSDTSDGQKFGKLGRMLAGESARASVSGSATGS